MKEFLLILASVLALSCASGASQTEVDNQITVEVKVAKVEQQDIEETVSATGVIFPKFKATVSAKISAPIRQMELLKGRSVRAGQVIAQLEDRDLRAARDEAEATLREATLAAEKLSSGVQPQDVARVEAAVSSAKAALETARALYNRRKELFDQGGIPKRELEAAALSLTTAENEFNVATENLRLLRQQFSIKDIEIARSRVEQARSRLQNLEAQISYAQITSPIDGLITDQLLYKGEMASSGAPLVTIMNLDEIIIKANFPEAAARKIRLGNAAQVILQEGELVAGSVGLISPAADLTTRLVEVWIMARNPDLKLRPGAFVKVTVTTAIIKGALVAPASSIQFQEGANEGTIITVDERSIAHPVKVTLGVRQGNLVQILSGINHGQIVVVEGNYGLADKTKVRIQQNQEKQ